MEELQKRILQDGVVLSSNILKVNSFINHQVDPLLMDSCGKALADHFTQYGPTKVLTAQTSGVAPAQATAFHLGVPYVFARESKPITLSGHSVLEARSRSYTKNKDIVLYAAAEFIQSNDKILIVDDFLASGTTAEALHSMCKQAGAEVIGMGFLVEKNFQGGRQTIHKDIPEFDMSRVVSLAIVGSLDDKNKRVILSDQDNLQQSVNSLIPTVKRECHSRNS
ncbi:unnamed protein product [Vitrella brassicaformis CCMP3155]|uniref:Phosphoribosyltransferase domain-containing protein n=2 Tax=Vitrella brassicaformis TaxID=1169539 RepID=A0A0G4ECU0_VITBC|nr:unnamed protein product [Vitrella brassicaformis CCMP3155]|mmetsp:Transcript_20452/g.49737  ORF Transcript_20452/g.49737 Transcript_20452/m.49737 type:complete len:223 (+) Transcript_20452:126-794(+)|eukprot:CEL93365.1 unnamed protein product [Vitrella brassicaformis CCMP3155]